MQGIIKEFTEPKIFQNQIANTAILEGQSRTFLIFGK